MLEPTDLRVACVENPLYLPTMKKKKYKVYSMQLEIKPLIVASISSCVVAFSKTRSSEQLFFRTRED